MAGRGGDGASCTIAVDASTGEVMAHVLTDGHADDAAQVPALLNQTEGHIGSVTGGPAPTTTMRSTRKQPLDSATRHRLLSFHLVRRPC